MGSQTDAVAVVPASVWRVMQQGSAKRGGVAESPKSGVSTRECATATDGVVPFVLPTEADSAGGLDSRAWPFNDLNEGPGTRYTDTLANFLSMYLERRLQMRRGTCCHEIEQLQRTIGRIMNAYVGFRVADGFEPPQTADFRKDAMTGAPVPSTVGLR